MPYPGETYISLFGDGLHIVADELRQFYAQLTAWLSVEHNDDGTHGYVTATDVSTKIGHDTGAISPPQITANQNNYAPTGLSKASRVYLTSDAARDITGLAGQNDGRRLWLVNAGGFTITLKYVSASSSVGNQIAAANSADVLIRPNGSVLLHYSTQSGTGYWYVLGA